MDLDGTMRDITALGMSIMSMERMNITTFRIMSHHSPTCMGTLSR